MSISRTRTEKPKELLIGLYAQHGGNWAKIMDDESMRGMGLLKNDAQETIHNLFREGTLFPEYNKKFKKACSKADTKTMKNLLKDEYQLNITQSSSYFQECSLSPDPLEAIKCLLTSTRIQLNKTNSTIEKVKRSRPRNGQANPKLVTGLGCILIDIKDENILKEALEIFLNDPRADPNIVYFQPFRREYPRGIVHIIRYHTKNIDSFLPIFLDHPKFELDDEILEQLIKSSKEDWIEKIINHPNKRFETLDFEIKESLVAACSRKLVDVVKILCQQPKIDIQECFHIVCKDNDADILSILLSRDDFDRNNIQITPRAHGFGIPAFSYSHSPLSIACLHGHLNIVKMLIEDGKADFNLKIEENDKEISIFNVACFSKSKELVEFFLSYPKIDKDYNKTLLSFCSKYRSGLSEIAQIVLDNNDELKETENLIAKSVVTDSFPVFYEHPKIQFLKETTNWDFCLIEAAVNLLDKNVQIILENHPSVDVNQCPPVICQALVAACDAVQLPQKQIDVSSVILLAKHPKVKKESKKQCLAKLLEAQRRFSMYVKQAHIAHDKLEELLDIFVAELSLDDTINYSNVWFPSITKKIYFFNSLQEQQRISYLIFGTFFHYIPTKILEYIDKATLPNDWLSTTIKFDPPKRTFSNHHVNLASLLSRTKCPELLERIINDEGYEFDDDNIYFMSASKECLLIIGKKHFNLLDKFCSKVPRTLIQEVKDEISLIFSKKSARK